MVSGSHDRDRAGLCLFVSTRGGSLIPRRATITLAAAGVLAMCGTAQASYPSATMSGWPEVSDGVFIGPRLVFATSATRQHVLNRRPQFRFFEAATVSSTLRPNRLRFRQRTLSTELIVRNSIGGMAGSRLAASPRGYAFLPGGANTRTATWCCLRGDEVVLYADGQRTAPIPVGVGIDGDRARIFFRTGNATAILRSMSPKDLEESGHVDESETEVQVAAAPRLGTTAIGTGVIAWSDNPASKIMTIGVPKDEGVDQPRRITMPGRIIDIKADNGVAAVTTLGSGGYRVLRVNANGTRQLAWRGALRPQVGIGRGLLVVGVRRVLLASRSGPVRRVAGASGLVAAVAADANRIGWMERVQVRDPKTRQTVRRSRARLAQVR